MAEGPFGEFTGYSLGERQREIVRYTAITHRRDAMFQDITVAHLDHMLLSTIPMEANLYRAVRAMVPSVKAVRVPGPFTCYVSIEQRLPGQAKNAIMAVFGADLYMKRVVVVDHDVDVFDDRQVNWALATRCQPDRDITIITNARGSDLDPVDARGRLHGQVGRGRDRQALPGRLHAAPPGAARRCGSASGPRGLPRADRRRERQLRRAWSRPSRAAAPTHPALRWDGGALTYRELAAAAGGFAGRCARGASARAIAWPSASPTGPDFVVAVLGGLAAGATVAPLDPLLKAEERADILADLRPALVVEPARRRGDRARRGRGARGEAARAGALHLGQHGRPKGAVLSHAALDVRQPLVGGPGHGRCAPTTWCWARCPSSHAFGLNGALLAPLLSAPPCAWSSASSPDAVADVIARDGVSVLPAVATMFHRLLEVPGFARRPRRLRLGVSGAAPCPWDLAQAWRARTGVRIVRGYGRTELFRPLSYLAADPTDHAECVGRPVPGVEVRVVDDEGRPLPAGDGRRAADPHARRSMDGYLGSAGDTAAVLRRGLVPDRRHRAAHRRRLRDDRGPQARAHQARRLLDLPGRGGDGAARPPGRGRGGRGRACPTPRWARRSRPSWR